MSVDRLLELYNGKTVTPKNDFKGIYTDTNPDKQITEKLAHVLIEKGHDFNNADLDLGVEQSACSAC